MKRLLLRPALIAVVTLPAVLVGAKIAVATIPGTDGTVHGCVKSSKSGQLYLVDPSAGQTCGKDTALDWNKPGAAGAKGLDGPKGFTGFRGSAGSSGYEQQSASYTSDSSGNGTGEADCSSGKVALAGGFSQTGVGRVAPLESAPKSDGSGWVVGVSGDPNISFTVYAVCATNGGS